MSGLRDRIASAIRRCAAGRVLLLHVAEQFDSLSRLVADVRTIEGAESTHADLRETQAEMSGRLRAVEAWWHQFGRRKQP